MEKVPLGLDQKPARVLAPVLTTLRAARLQAKGMVMAMAMERVMAMATGKDLSPSHEPVESLLTV